MKRRSKQRLSFHQELGSLAHLSSHSRVNMYKRLSPITTSGMPTHRDEFSGWHTTLHFHSRGLLPGATAPLISPCFRNNLTSLMSISRSSLRSSKAWVEN